MVARLYLGRGGALGAVAFFLLVRGALTVIIAGPFHQPVLHFPLYAPEAVLVELVAWRLGDRRPVLVGTVAGALIGTVGFAAEWGWSHIWMPLPWTTSMLGMALPLTFLAAVAGGVIGGFIAGALIADRRPVVPRWPIGVVAAAALVFCIGFLLPMNAGSPVSAHLTLKTLTPGPRRQVQVTRRPTRRVRVEKPRQRRAYR